MTEPHEPTDSCSGVHCHGCGLDHEGKAWLWCFECGHAYRRPRDLRKAYRRAAWRMLRRGPIKPHRQLWFRGNEFEPSVAWQLWRIITVRANKIYFCQICLHDFI